jgi:hypothetical protein
MMGEETMDKNGMRIYVASSWRNEVQKAVVLGLRAMGHEVYDFKNPAPGNNGFAWSGIDPHWKQWDTEAFRRALQHPIAQGGFALDMNALRTCDACVLVLPCGRSAHLELGWAAGAGKRTFVLSPDPEEPELMYLMCDGIYSRLSELGAALRQSHVARVAE